jgi:hypothetical protein
VRIRFIGSAYTPSEAAVGSSVIRAPS